MLKFWEDQLAAYCSGILLGLDSSRADLILYSFVLQLQWRQVAKRGWSGITMNQVGAQYWHDLNDSGWVSRSTIRRGFAKLLALHWRHTRSTCSSPWKRRPKQRKSFGQRVDQQILGMKQLFRLYCSSWVPNQKEPDEIVQLWHRFLEPWMFVCQWFYLLSLFFLMIPW